MAEMGGHGPKANGAQQVSNGGERVESNAVMVETPRARAKGTRPPFGEQPQPAPWCKAAGWAAAAEIKAEIVARKKAILDAQLARALDPAHPQGHAAAVNLLDRIMPPESKATLAGDGDAPLITRIERVIIGPDDPEK
jgi:hypothetical protein